MFDPLMQFSPGLGSNKLTKFKNPSVDHQKWLEKAVEAKLDNRGLNFQHSAQAILRQRLEDAAQNSLITPTSVPIFELDPEAFSPEAIAERILNFVGKAIAERSANNGADKDALLAQAKIGVENGFNEAVDVLKNLGIYQDEIQDNAEKTYDLINQGLNNFSFDSAPAVSTALEFGLSSQSYAEQKSLSLQIQTKDGDTVTINIQRDLAYEQSTSELQQQGLSIHESRTAFSSQNNLQYTVEGSLDEEEMTAIENLVRDIHTTSSTFFNGDSQVALHHALDIGYDTTEIAAFSLQLSHQQTSSATQAYATIDGLKENTRGHGYAPKQAEQLFSPLSGVMKELNGLVHRSSALLAQARLDAKQLFDALSVMDSRNYPALDKLEQHTQQPLSSFTERFFQGLPF
ncbi:MAG: DUF5610 domain-containing protein [Gammaproteobacteria bacterium]|nr:DUF5610 domain-containing protein [Gammaproteobacteria bacterium]